MKWISLALLAGACSDEPSSVTTCDAVKIVFETGIDEHDDEGEVDGMPSFTGPCDSLVVPWLG